MAVCLSIVSFFAGFAFRVLFNGPQSICATVTLLFVLYLGYLFRKSRLKAGKVVLSVGSLAALSAGWFFLNAGVSFIFAAAGILWLFRSSLFYSRLPPIAADLALNLAALAVAAWIAENGGGTVTGVWGFFLIQALWALIPGRMSPTRLGRQQDGGTVSRFDRAHATALAALRRLADN